MSAISIKGVVIGAVFDIVVSGIFGFAAGMIYVLSAGITAPEDIARLATAPEVRVFSYVSGGLISIIAGYLAARIAGRGELINGTLSSVLCVGLGLVAALVSHPPEFGIKEILQFAFSPLLGLLGGYLRLRQVQ